MSQSTLPQIIRSSDAVKLAARRARAFADEAIRAQLARRLKQLDELVGKLAYSMNEIKSARCPAQKKR